MESYAKKLDSIPISLERLRENLGITEEYMVKMIGCNYSEYEKIKLENFCSEDSKKRAIHLLNIYFGLRNFFNDDCDKVKKWFVEEQPGIKGLKSYLNSCKPLELLFNDSIESENSTLISEYVSQIRGLK